MKRLRRKHIIRLNRKARKQETPIFERLEPRLLLNADVTGLSGTQNIAPLSTDQPDNTVDVSLDTQSNSLTADAQLVLVTPQAVPYSQDFSAGKPDSSQGWEYYSDSQGQIQVVGGKLLMDDYGVDYVYSLNEAILHVDLTGKTNVTLTLDQASLQDENTGLPSIFTDHFQGDGIALSVNGTNWVRVTNLTSSFTGQSFYLDTIIQQAKDAAGSNDVSDVRIKFQQYDNTNGNDGRTFDNIQVTGAAVSSITVQDLPYNQDFSAGKPGASQGWEYFSDNQGQIQVVSGQLLMDDYGVDYIYSLNEAILHLDLTGKANIILTLDQTSLQDESDALPASFVDHFQGDGIALSVDGTNWVRVTNLTSSFTGGSFFLDSIIEQAKTMASSDDLSNVRIKFQQYDNTNGNDGRKFDNIHVTASTVNTLPYTQDFSAGKPTESQGWEYYSDNQGQIQVVNGRLRMDDYGVDYIYSLNEAILHVDLTNMINVKLTLDQYSLQDETDALPASFSDHFKGDGIALSVDGVNWITVTNLSGSFTGQTFNLDSIIAQAKTAANSTDVSNVRIKFQQYDNTNGNDGREFDNIQLTGFEIQELPAVQNFESGKPGQYEGWEYYSNNQGQIQVTGGRLRMDDSVSDYTYSLNEAILHVDLTNAVNVKLTLDQYSLNDGNDPLPASFDGHFQGDGIALSVDGVHWITVTSLGASFTNQTYNLDSIIADAKAAAGPTADLSNVRIKFQQYGNSYSPNEGREFDNIQVTGLVIQDVPCDQNFDAGKPGQYDGWEYYSDSQGQIQVVGGQLLMDDYGVDYIYSLNEAILHVNLTGKTNAILTLDHTSLQDENNGLPTSFTDHYQGDGIAVSVDGTHWVRVANLTSSFTGQSFSLDSAIAQAKTNAGIDDVSNVRIKLQQYDNTNGNDGRKFDNIHVSASETSNVLYTQDFSSGKPTLGWEYYSNNQGQIQVIDGKLRMDDYGVDYIYSLNEAILHLDLTGQTGVILTLDHTSILDENTALPALFSGHYQGDGISLSVDGINWVTVTSLTSSFTGRSFALDSIIAQAQVAAGGSTDLSDVRIKFQQYDNTNGNDGREFDNIQITAS